MEKNARTLMSETKFYEGYSRYDNKKKRYETWEESVDRVMSMHSKFYKDKMTPELSELMEEVSGAYREKLFLGAQRALQFGGEQLLKHHARLYNCYSSYCDRPEIFGETMYLLLCGGGVGFSVQTQHITELPDIQKRMKSAKTFVVPDSVEGWAQSIDVLMSSFFVGGGKHPEYEGRKIYFDLEKIRPKGSLISGGFKAPGGEPLRLALDKIEYLIKAEIAKGYTRLRPIVVYDIIMFLSDSVISGGVRRSATICMFSKDDQEMIEAKTGSWFVDNPQRGRSNNSAMLLRDQTTKEEFKNIMESVKHSGEPGFIFTENLDFLNNPCVTGDSSIMTSEGPRLANNLIGKKFDAIVDGKAYTTTDKGFWKTGRKDIFKLTLINGSSLKLTDNHKVQTDRGWVEVKNLYHYDKVRIHNHSSYTWGSTNSSESEIGWLMGNLVGDGTFDKFSAILSYWGKEAYLIKMAKEYLNKHFYTYKDFSSKEDGEIVRVRSAGLQRAAAKYEILPKDKTPNHFLEEQSSEFYKGYLRGLFDADGTVQGTQKKGISIELTQNNLTILEQVQRMLLRLGITSRIYKSRRAEGYYSLPDGKGGYKDFLCKTVHELRISKESLFKYRDGIGFSNINKMETLEKLLSMHVRRPNRDKYYIDIDSIEYVGVEDVYDVTVPGLEAFDANGLYVHNCVEISMLAKTEDGESGFQSCNLTEINGGKSTTKEIFFHQCKVASILGTLQAGYTDFKFLSDASRKIIEREALIGVGITGIMNNPQILADENILIEGAGIVKKWNKIVAKMIGINQAARTTTIKPSGNASVILETASGIHGEHSPRYLRHVQLNEETEVAQLLKKENPKMCEKSVWGNDIVVAFPVVSPETSIYKKDLLGVKQLEYVAKVQGSWIEAGTNVELCTDPRLRHNVSNTITVDDWDKVADYIYDNRYSFCGVSLLSAVGDKAYPQAPFTEVLSYEETTKKYGEVSMFTSALIEAGLQAFKKDLWSACNTAMGYGEILSEGHDDLLKRDFIRRFDKFSENFKSKEECANCLKDVYNLHKWWKIQKNIKFIDWKDNLCEKKYVDADTMGAQACAGGKCEI